MTLPPRQLTAVVCDSDIIGQTALRHAAEVAGFEVLETAENGPNLLRSLEFHQPSLLLLAHELTGMTGLDVIAEVNRHDDHPESILITSDERVLDEAREYSVIGVPGRGDLEALERALDDAKHLFETGERRAKHDRRGGADRRKTQDWSKVISERRSGGDRRKGPRRSEDADGSDRRSDEQPDRRQNQDWRQVTLERRSSEERRET